MCVLCKCMGVKVCVPLHAQSEPTGRWDASLLLSMGIVLNLIPSQVGGSLGLKGQWSLDKE